MKLSPKLILIYKNTCQGNYSTGEPHMSFLGSWILVGHGNIARTHILQGDWGSEIQLGLGNTARAEMSGEHAGPLWGSEIQPELRSWRETSGEH